MDKANVNRKTFYYHYHNISDLINWMYTQGFASVVERDSITPLTWMGVFSDAMDYVRRESSWLYAIYASRYAPEFRLCLNRLFDKAMTRFIRSAAEIFEREHNTTLHLSPLEIGYVRQYYTMAFFGMLEQWFTDGMKESNS